MAVILVGIPAAVFLMVIAYLAYQNLGRSPTTSPVAIPSAETGIADTAKPAGEKPTMETPADARRNPAPPRTKTRYVEPEEPANRRPPATVSAPQPSTPSATARATASPHRRDKEGGASAAAEASSKPKTEKPSPRVVRGRDPAWAIPGPDPAPREPVLVGRVDVQADGGYSDVYLGQRYLGTTPFQIELPVGRHALRLLPFGKEPGDIHVVTIYPDSTVSVNVTLRREAE